MTKRKRFEAAIAGRPVDRPPVTAWVHFVTDESPAEVFADRAAAFFERLDFDICKVVNDYRYPLPEGLETIEGPEDMRRFRRLAMDHPAFVQQPRAIRLLRERLGPDVPILDTGFDPFQQVMRRAGYDRAHVVFAHPEAASEMLEAVCATMEDFMAALREAGCDGVFFSINGAITGGSRAVDRATYERFMRPYDLRMLTAMAPMVRILHVHGAPVDVTRVLDYPIEALSVSDRLAGNPSLADLRRLTDKCLMGGVNEVLITERGVDALRAEVRDAVRQNGGMDRLIIAPGCTIPTQTPSFLLRALVEETKALALRRAA
ncbi:uroporphyrinogen decarboxylase family protein [Elioraea sp.]|uniref:uroporphyrinogen decarboxylase family protein n=1 Tax=Elioraea sp. TaxID=2185103 RepID=UPI00307F3FA6